MLHKRKDFAALCGIKPRELSVYISRGNVTVSKGNLIDDELPDNADFLVKKQEKGGAIDIEVVPKKFTAAQEKRIERLEKISELNTQKRELESDELRERISLLRIKKEKQEGFLIPTALVKELFGQQFRSITIAFQQGAEQLIVEISKKKRLTREESAKLRKSLLGIINEAVDDSIAHTKKNVEDIVDAYSKKMGVGERR